MTSEARIQANRRNALKSTGPRTEAGKKKSSMNALKHGFTAKQATMDPVEEELFLDFADGITNELKPRNDLELQFVDQIISCSWRLRRVLRIETDELRSHFAADGHSLGQHLFAGGGYKAVFSLSAHETRINRSLDRAFKQLIAIRQNPEILSPAKGVTQPVDWAKSPEAVDPRSALNWMMDRTIEIKNLADERLQLESMAVRLDSLIRDYNEAEEALWSLEHAPSQERDQERILAGRDAVWSLTRQLEEFRQTVACLRQNIISKTNPSGDLDASFLPARAHSLELAKNLDDSIAEAVAARPDDAGPDEPAARVGKPGPKPKSQPAAEYGLRAELSDCAQAAAKQQEIDSPVPEPALLEGPGEPPTPEAAPRETPSQPPTRSPAKPEAPAAGEIATSNDPPPPEADSDETDVGAEEVPEPPQAPDPRAQRRAEIERLPEDSRRALETLRIYQRMFCEYNSSNSCQKALNRNSARCSISHIKSENRIAFERVPTHLLEFDERLDMEEERASKS